MTEQDWKKLRHFNKDEAWGDPSKMNFMLLALLDHARNYTNRRFIVTRGYATSGHSIGSEHYNGNAVDFIVLLSNKKPLDFILEILRFPFSGVGIYPHWKLKGHEGEAQLGVHLDCGEINSLEPGIVQARWIGVTVNNMQQYVAFDESNLKRYCIVK